MRRRFGEVLSLGVAARGVALVRSGRGQAQLLAELALDTLTPESLAVALTELFAQHPAKAWPLVVTLADELVHLFDVEPPTGSSRIGDLQAAAALRLQSLYGVSSHEWRIDADWRAGGRFLAAAVPMSLLEQLQQAASAQRCHLVQVAPQFVAVLNRWRRVRRADAWFAHAHDGRMTLAVTENARLVALRSLQLPAQCDASWLAGLLEREALRLGARMPAQLQLAGADAAISEVADAEVAGVRCTWLDADAPRDRSPLAALACAGSAA